MAIAPAESAHCSGNRSAAPQEWSCCCYTRSKFLDPWRSYTDSAARGRKRSWQSDCTFQAKRHIQNADGKRGWQSAERRYDFLQFAERGKRRGGNGNYRSRRQIGAAIFEWTPFYTKSGIPIWIYGTLWRRSSRSEEGGIKPVCLGSSLSRRWFSIGNHCLGLPGRGKSRTRRI